MTREPHTNHCCSSADTRRDAVSQLGTGTPQRAVVLSRILAEAAAGHCERALCLADAYPEYDPQIVNAKGVCLMRLGRACEALSLFRSLVTTQGGTAVQSDRPDYLKMNYATALLLAGHLEACLDVLEGLDAGSPVVRRLRDAVQRWETSLSFSQRLDWWINRVVPSCAAASLDFAPGEFGPVDTQDSATLHPFFSAQTPAQAAESVHSSSHH